MVVLLLVLIPLIDMANTILHLHGTEVAVPHPWGRADGASRKSGLNTIVLI